MPREKCPACGGPATAETMVVREMMFGLDEEFAYAGCATCGSLWLQDVPEQLGRFYPEDYYSVDTDPERMLGRPGMRQFTALVTRSILFGNSRIASAAGTLIRKRQFRTFLKVMDSIGRAGLTRGHHTRVLDVGCGSGILIYSLGLAGMETVVGVDPFAPGDRRFDSGAILQRRDLAEVDGEFDLVMFHHSFEHVPDPNEALTRATEVLAPGGRILIRMPTVSSECFQRYGVDWVQLDAPRHLTVLSREGVRALADQHGLRVVSEIDDSTSFQFWGSEQVRRGIPLMDARSHMMAPRSSVFAQSELALWEEQSVQLNARGQGDQAAWVLERLSPEA